VALDRRVLLLVGVLIVFAIILFIASKSRTPVTQTPAPAQSQTTTQQTPQVAAFPLSATTITDLATQAKQEYAFAVGQAKSWRDDATFVAQLTEYTDSIDPANGKNTYIFASPSLPTFYWTIVINQARGADGKNTYERMIRYKEDYVLDTTTIDAPLQYWKLTYLDALVAAEKLGAQDIRTKNKVYTVNILLSAQKNRYLAWDVEYKVAGKTVLRKTLNAATGEEVATQPTE